MSYETNEEAAAFRSEEEVRAVVRDFESCAVAPDDFRHRQHLVVALLYLLESPPAEAHERLRANLLAFLRHHGVGAHVYHETITLFWLRRVRSFLDARPARAPLVALTNGLLEACGDSKLVYDYYTRERLDSPEARAAWAEPDVKPLDF